MQRLRKNGRRSARAFLKAELRKADVTYADLAKRLKKHGFKETEASITNKLKRGTFSGHVLSGLLSGRLELNRFALEDV